MTNFFFFLKLQKTLFLAHFPNFWGKISFSTKSGCHAQLHKCFWHHAKIQRNLMTHFQENTQRDARTDPISQNPSSYCQGSNKYNCSKLAFKSNDIKYDVGLTNYYCITVKMRKTSSIHKLIQQILKSHELSGQTHF